MKDVFRLMLIAGGTLCVGLGVLGIFLPMLPTTPFLLLAAYCYSRSSPRFHHWLLHNRWFGKYIRNYREGRGMPMREKVVSITVLWLTIGGSVYLLPNVWVRLLLLAVAAGVTVHLIRIKTFVPEKRVKNCLYETY